MSNSISLTGRLGKDAVVRTAGKSQVMSFTVANNIGFGDRKSTNWFSCSVWGARATQKIADMLVKGNEVFISGELSTRTWGDNDENTSLEVNVTVLDFLGSKKDKPAPQATAEKAEDESEEPPF